MPFANCASLTSISLPGSADGRDECVWFCISLASVSLPQVRTVGRLPCQVRLADLYFVTGMPRDGRRWCVWFLHLAGLCFVAAGAYDSRRVCVCWLLTSLTSLYFDNDIAIGYGIFADIAPTKSRTTSPTRRRQVQGATLGGMPVVRLPLSAKRSRLMATQSRVAGGRQADIIAPLYDSGTNVTVTSTQGVYSVAVTGAGPVGTGLVGAVTLDSTGQTG